MKRLLSAACIALFATACGAPSSQLASAPKAPTAPTAPTAPKDDKKTDQAKPEDKIITGKIDYTCKTRPRKTTDLRELAGFDVQCTIATPNSPIASAANTPRALGGVSYELCDNGVEIHDLVYTCVYKAVAAK